jgi:hypothetical protein
MAAPRYQPRKLRVNLPDINVSDNLFLAVLWLRPGRYPASVGGGPRGCADDWPQCLARSRQAELRPVCPPQKRI